MNIMVVGGGGREHAIIKKLRENPDVSKIYALPGNAGISEDAECIGIKATDIDEITSFAASNTIDFAVVGPDDPLVLGLVDRLTSIGVPTFGPTSRAAVIEGSKVFSKQLMKKYGIPTAGFEVFDSAESAIEYLLNNEHYPIVIKADGLALGKGVLIAANQDEALSAVRSIMIDRIFGQSGSKVVIEEFLTGPEVSVLAFTDSKTLIPMISSMDHKKVFDGDRGLNTGGMGTIAPNPYYSVEIADQCMEKIFIPTMTAMNKEGRPFKGCLYFGVMLTVDGPKVIEYNCRFGDPEAQVVLPLLDSDLLTVMQAVVGERLSEVSVRFSGGSACCVVAASGGYPLKYETGFPINNLKDTGLLDVNIYHAGTRLSDGKIVTAGGRVLGVTAVGPDLNEAVDRAYRAIQIISFEGMYYRKDIGKSALEIKLREKG